MKLKLKRSQQSGMMGLGKVKFSLFAQTELAPDEAERIKRYKLQDDIVYQKAKIDTSGVQPSIKGFATALAARALNLTISVKDLVHGTTVECKDIAEMLAAEEQIKEACGMLKEILETAAAFGGEEVIEY